MNGQHIGRLPKLPRTTIGAPSQVHPPVPCGGGNYDREKRGCRVLADNVHHLPPSRPGFTPRILLRPTSRVSVSCDGPRKSLWRALVASRLSATSSSRRCAMTASWLSVAQERLWNICNAIAIAPMAAHHGTPAAMPVIAAASAATVTMPFGCPLRAFIVPGGNMRSLRAVWLGAAWGCAHMVVKAWHGWGHPDQVPPAEDQQ